MLHGRIRFRHKYSSFVHLSAYAEDHAYVPKLLLGRCFDGALRRAGTGFARGAPFRILLGVDKTFQFIDPAGMFQLP